MQMSSRRKVVLINCFDTYEHRVELLMKYFQSKSCDVKVITSDWRHFHKTVRTECPEGFEMIHAKPYMKNLSAERLISHHQFAVDAFERATKYEPDLLWVLVPPNSLVKQADIYKKRNPKVKLILDVIDMWPETMPISRFKTLPPFSFWKNLRDRHLNCADVVVTECDLYQQVLHRVCSGQEMHTLYLARKPARERLVSNLDLPKDRVALCYLGSINNIIDIPCITQIIRNIEGNVDFHIVGDGEKRQALIDEATEAGANVIFHGKVYDPDEKQAIFDQCHFGLNIMKESVFVGLTMKSMDYLELGLPIINNIGGDTEEIVEKEKIGINFHCGCTLSKEVMVHIQNNRPRVREVFEKNFTEKMFYLRLDQLMSRVLD